MGQFTGGAGNVLDAGSQTGERLMPEIVYDFEAIAERLRDPNFDKHEADACERLKHELQCQPMPCTAPGTVPAPTCPPPAWLLGFRRRSDNLGGSLPPENLHCRLESFLSSFDQLGFLGFLFTQRERPLAVSFHGIQTHPSSLK